MKVLIPMMKEDAELWSYMVDDGDRLKANWSRKYALTVMATIRPDYVKQVWDHATKERLGPGVDEQLG